MVCYIASTCGISPSTITDSTGHEPSLTLQYVVNRGPRHAPTHILARLHAGEPVDPRREPAVAPNLSVSFPYITCMQ